MDEFTWVTRAEGFISADPLPSHAELAAFYEKIYFQSPDSATYSATYSDDELKQKRLRTDIIIEAVRQAVGGDPKGRSFLEIGCGEGFLLQAAHDAELAPTGIDFTAHALEAFHPEMMCCFEAGDCLLAIDRMIREGRTFDIVSLQNVLEHVVDPKSLVASLRRLLPKGGIGVIQVPNDFSRLQMAAQAQGRISRRYWFSPPQHLHYFNKSNLLPFLERHGFEVVDSFGDFPIEFFIFNDASNYAIHSEVGKAAHLARVALDLLMAEAGLANYLDFCRGLAKVQMGRNLTVLIRAS